MPDPGPGDDQTDPTRREGLSSPAPPTGYGRMFADADMREVAEAGTEVVGPSAGDGPPQPGAAAPQDGVLDEEDERALPRTGQQLSAEEG